MLTTTHTPGYQNTHDAMEEQAQAEFMEGVAAAQERLTKLLNDYGSIQTIHPAVVLLRSSRANDLMFQQAITHDYQLLLNRSSKLENFEINIFEVAFIRLMEDPKTHVGAIQIFVEEILGLKAVIQPLKLRALMGAVKMRTMFLQSKSGTTKRRVRSLISVVAMNDDHSQPSGTHHHAPFMIPQTGSGTQLLSNIISRTGYAPIGIPVVGAPSGQGHPLASKPQSANVMQSRNSIHHTRQQMSLATGKENRPEFDAGNAQAASNVAMDDPKLAALLSRYRTAKHHISSAMANSAAHLILTDTLRDSARQCILCMSRINPGDKRLDELHKAYEYASGLGKESMQPQGLQD